MCGRFVQTLTPEELRSYFGFIELPNLPPRYNVAPTQDIGLVRLGEDGARHFTLVRWGFVPAGADAGKHRLVVNIRSESAARAPDYRRAMRLRRGIVPASGFFEWGPGPGGERRAFHISRRDGDPLAFAALWEGPAGPDGAARDTAAILTTAANDTIAPIHDRMPVIVEPADIARWLDPAVPPEQLADILAPAAPGLLETTLVSNRVNNHRNDDPSVIEPSETAEPGGPRQPRLF